MRLQPKRHVASFVILAVVLSFGLMACDSNTTGPEGPPTLTVVFGGGNTLPPASGDASLFASEGATPTQVWVWLEDVCFQGVGDGDQGGGQNGRECILEEDAKGWKEVAGPSAEWETLVEDIEVPAGIGQLRFILTDVVIVADANGADEVYATSAEALASLNEFIPNDPAWEMDGEAHCPSCSQTGWKVIFPDGDPDMQGGEYMLLAMFDVSESFGKPRGNSGRWVMHPVIRGTLIQRVGTISGTVSVDANATFDGAAFPGSCGGLEVTKEILVEYFRPVVSNGDSRDAGTDPVTGAYEITPLAAPHIYDLDWTASVPFGTEALGFTTVTVTDPDGTPDDKMTELLIGQTATVDYVIVEAICDN
jgi:hypothetical protein